MEKVGEGKTGLSDQSQTQEFAFLMANILLVTLVKTQVEPMIQLSASAFELH